MNQPVTAPEAPQEDPDVMTPTEEAEWNIFDQPKEINMNYLVENINTTIAKIEECMARDPQRAKRLLGHVKAWANDLAQQADSQTRRAELPQQREKE